MEHTCIRVCYLLVVVLLCVKLGLGNDVNAVDEMRKLQDAFWESQMRVNPTSSSYHGMYKYNDLIESYALSRFQEDRNRTLGFMAQLTAINRDELDAGGKVNYDILNDTLQTFLDGNTWAEYGALSPINFLGGIQLYSGPYMAPSSTRGDFENYIVRLHSVDKQVDEIIESCRRAIELNRTLHNVSLARVPQQLDGKIFNTSEESPYYYWYFGQKLNESHVQTEEEREAIRQRGRDAVNVYIDAFRKLKNFIVNEYMPRTRTEYGVYAWDPSHGYYKECLKWHLSYAMLPDDVHNVGLEEVAKISANMQMIMTKRGFNGTVREFFESLEGDEQHYSNDTEKILTEYRKVVFERIAPKLSTVFKNIPDVPLVIEASSNDGLGGGYSSASETSPGRFTINLFRPLEVPFFEMMALSLHEANPGHHMQHSFSMKASLPDFRKHALLAFNQIPNWFPYYSAYGEGWALYSEYLGEEMGLYKDDFEMMGRYSYDILRAARLVVDTGLHYKKWSRQQAIEYLMNYTALGIGSAENEIDRYITWPGQACAYKIGEIRIRELRKKAENELGDTFDIKDFHSLMLENGGLPMALLESMTDAWIADSKSTKTSAATTLHGYVAKTLLVAAVVLIQQLS